MPCGGMRTCRFFFNIHYPSAKSLGKIVPYARPPHTMGTILGTATHQRYARDNMAMGRRASKIVLRQCSADDGDYRNHYKRNLFFWSNDAASPPVSRPVSKTTDGLLGGVGCGEIRENIRRGLRLEIRGNFSISYSTQRQLIPR